jgi:hypothetical protein
VEVDRDAERRADLILTPATLADGLGIVEVDGLVPPQRSGQVTATGDRWPLRDSGAPRLECFE